MMAVTSRLRPKVELFDDALIEQAIQAEYVADSEGSGDLEQHPRWTDWYTDPDVRAAFRKSTRAVLEAIAPEIARRMARHLSTSLIDWEVMYGHETATPEVAEAHRIAAWIEDETDALTAPGQTTEGAAQ